MKQYQIGDVVNINGVTAKVAPFIDNETFCEQCICHQFNGGKCNRECGDNDIIFIAI